MGWYVRMGWATGMRLGLGNQWGNGLRDWHGQPVRERLEGTGLGNQWENGLRKRLAWATSATCVGVDSLAYNSTSSCMFTICRCTPFSRISIALFQRWLLLVVSAVKQFYVVVWVGVVIVIDVLGCVARWTCRPAITICMSFCCYWPSAYSAATDHRPSLISISSMC